MNSHHKRYLIVGITNTILGYLIGVLAYNFLYGFIDIVIIGIISSIISISISFATYKIYVFKTNGNWFREYLKAYVVYGVSAFVSIGLLWLFVEKMNMSIWIAQGLTVGFTVFISYLGHNLYTFKKNIGRDGP